MKAIVLVLVPMVLLLSQCSNNDKPTSPADQSTITMESKVSEKMGMILPAKEYLTYLDIVSDAKIQNDYSETLQELDRATDSFLATCNGSRKESAANTAPGVSVEKLQLEIDRLRNELSHQFGDIYTVGRESVMNAGLGYGNGVLGGVGASLSCHYVAGVGVVVDGGYGTETAYDFRRFEKGIFPVKYFNAGIGIGVGFGGGVDASLNAVYYQTWFSGLKQSLSTDYSGANVSIGYGISGDLKAVVGLSAGVDISSWTSSDCDYSDIPCLLTNQSKRRDPHGITLGFGASGSFGEKATGNIDWRSTTGVSWNDAPISTTCFIESTENSPLRYLVAGIKMAEDIMKLQIDKPSAFPIHLPAIALSLLYGVISYQPSVNTVDGLVAYYPFDGNAKDMSGNGNDGIVSGASPIEGHKGVSGTAYSFNGSSSNIRLPSAVADRFENGVDLTLSFWMKVKDWYYEPGTGNTFFPVFTKCVNGNLTAGWELTMMSHTPLFVSTVGAGIVKTAYTSLEVKRNVWYHIIVSYSYVSGKVRFYSNGSFVGEMEFKEPLLRTNGGSLFVGYSPVGGLDHANGIIDELMVYERILTDSEVLEISKM